MKIVAISDTHGQHHPLVLPKGDMLIHTGDVSGMGRRAEVQDFVRWFAQQDFAYKIFIAGNHDFFFENALASEIDSLIPENIIYLNDSGTVINGLHIWGSPITPWFYDWAFNRRRGADISKHWSLIPSGTNILITHGPAFKRLDKTTGGDEAGCKDLLLKIEEIQPQVHICGHIHEAYGMVQEPQTKFINASVLNERYKLVNAPVVFDVETVEQA